MLYRTLFAVLIMALTIHASESEINSPDRPVRTTIGFAFGTPSALFPVVTRYFGDKYGMRMSGSYFPGRGKRYIAGFQANFVRKLRESRNSLLDASLIIGYLNINCNEVYSHYWRYVGLAGSIRWKALFCETGLTIGSGAYPNPQGMFQLGVVFYTERESK